MPIKNDVKQIRICDLCGKEEGKHLKSKDFFEEAPVLIVKNHEGASLSFQLNVDMWHDDPDESENTLYDIINQHDELSNPRPQQPQAFINIIPMNMVQPEQIDTVSDFIVCKVCYNNMVNMIRNYGKFDKETNF